MDSQSYSIKALQAKPETITPNWAEYIENLSKDVSNEWDEGPKGKIDGTKGIFLHTH
jgi:hypothetical protein